MDDGTTRIHFAVLCGFVKSTMVTGLNRVDDTASAFVLGWWHIRSGYLCIAVISGVLVGAFWP